MELANQTLSNTNIICPINDDCIISCNSNYGFNCNGLNILCQNNINGTCKLTCIGEDSCKNLNLIATNVNSIQILCTYKGMFVNILKTR